MTGRAGRSGHGGLPWLVATLDLHATGAADPDTVWNRYADLALWRTWSPQIRSVQADGTRLVNGLSGDVVGPLGVRVHFVVDAVDGSERSWSWRVQLGPIRVRLAHDVEAHPEGARTGLRLTGPLPLLAGYAPVAQIALWRLVRP